MYNKGSNFLRCIFIIFACLLCASFIRIIFSGQILSFSAFLELLSDTSTTMFSASITDFTIYGNWGIFDGFRAFLNIFASLFSVLVFIVTNLLNVLIFILNFVRYLILGY